MQKNSIEDMVNLIMDGLDEYFGNRIGGFVLEEKADFTQMFQELKKELELRISDKYLESHGWK